MDRNDPPMLLPDNAQSDNNRYSLVLAEQTLPTKSNELTDLARAEIGTDFILDTEMPKANRLQRLFCVLMLLLTLFLVYFHFPRPQPLIELTNEISFKDFTAPTLPKYKELCSNAQDLREKRHYHESVDILAPAVAELQKTGLNKKTIRQNQLLFAIYLDSIRQIKQTPSAALQDEFRKREQNARELVRKIIQYDPDPVQWHLLEIDLHLNHNMLAWNTTVRYNKASEARNKAMVDRIKKVLRMLDSAEIRLKRSKIEEEEKVKNLSQIDRWRVQLLIQQWKYSTKDLSEDDFGDPGVEEREKAYEIAKRYDNVLEFLEMRKYIINMIHANNSGYYYWNKNEYWWKAHLEDERDKIDEKIKNAKSTKGKMK